MDLETTNELLTTTRAVRKRLDFERPVDPETVRECLRIAMQAPIGGSRQRSRFIVVDDPALKAKAAELYREGAIESFKWSRAQADTRSTEKAYEGATYLANNLERVPVLVFFCIQGRMVNGTNHEMASFYGSVMPTVWCFQLALRARGLGSVFTTAHLRKEGQFARLFSIPYEDVSQVALVPVAHTIGVDFKPASREPLAEVCFHNAWGYAWS